MTHAIINDFVKVLQVYLEDDVPRAQHVPVTLNHFKIMAKLGREPVSTSTSPYDKFFNAHYRQIVLAAVARD